MSVHLEASFHVARCCARHGCAYNDDQCPIFFGQLAQHEPCDQCVNDEFLSEHDRKTPIPAPVAHLTAEQMMDSLVGLLDTKEVQEKITEAVIDILRDHLLSIAGERRRGSYSLINPAVEDKFED